MEAHYRGYCRITNPGALLVRDLYSSTRADLTKNAKATPNTCGHPRSGVGDLRLVQTEPVFMMPKRHRQTTDKEDDHFGRYVPAGI